MGARLAIFALLAATAAVFVSPALATPGIDGRDVWCLENENLERVILSAELLELGTAGGAKGTEISPANTNGAISMRRWRELSPADFRLACNKAYAAHFGMASLEAAQPDDGNDETLPEELAMATAPAVVGAIAGFQLSRLARAEERRRQRAAALQASLTHLSTDLDQLAIAVGAEEQTGESRVAVRRRATEMIAEIPATAPSEERATGALGSLISMLAGGTLNADALNRSQGEVDAAVRQVIAETEKRRS